MLRRLSGQRTGEFVVVGLFCVGKGIVWDSAACLAGQRKALCPTCGRQARLESIYSIIWFKVRRCKALDGRFDLAVRSTE